MEQPLSIRIPEGATISNRLYAQMPLAERDQDIAYIQLPNESYVSIGWFPPHDPHGKYVVRGLVRMSARVQQNVKTPQEAVFVAQRLAEDFSGKVIHFPRSQTTAL